VISVGPATQSGSILPNGTASFTLYVNDSAPSFAGDHVTLSGTQPDGWSYDLSPLAFDISGNSTQLVALTIYAPPDAVPGTSVNLTFTATSNLTGASNAAVVALSVRAPPPPPPQQPPAAPLLTIRASDSSAPAGSNATGDVLLSNADSGKLEVDLSAPGATFETASRVLYPGTDAGVAVTTHVPADAPVGSLIVLTIQATVTTADGHSFPFQTRWNVTVLAPPALPSAGASPGSGNATQGNASSSGPAGPSPPSPPASTPPALPPAPYDLSVTVFPSTIPIAPGMGANATVRLVNTGTQPLHVTLAATAADRWPVSFDAPTVDLAAGVTRDVQMSLTAPADVIAGGTGSGTVTVTGDAGLLRTADFKLSIITPPPRDDSQAAAAVQEPAPPAGPTLGISPATATVVVGLGAVGGAALLVANRPLREKLVWVAVGLYTRLAKPDVLGHPERDRLYKLIEAQPGAHFHALQRELQWNTGTLTYHLRVLERHGFIVDRRDGAYRRFYLQGAAPRKELFSPDAPQGLRADVLEAIRSHHGISQSDLALALSANKQTVNYHVKALERQGIIRVEKRGRDTYLYPATAPGLGPGEVHA
jgi:DNA-binding MarR family transcriptional regulator